MGTGEPRRRRSLAEIAWELRRIDREYEKLTGRSLRRRQNQDKGARPEPNRTQARPWQRRNLAG